MPNLLKTAIICLFLGFAFTQTSLAVKTPTTTINISSGLDRKGYGDLASNLLMAKTLKQMYPEFVINLVIESKSETGLGVLLPGYKQIPSYFGVNIVQPNEPVPRADYVLIFSEATDAHQHRPSLLASAPYVLTFHEYYEARHDGSLIQKLRYNGHTMFIHHSTGAKNLGFYVSPRLPDIVSLEGLNFMIDFEKGKSTAEIPIVEAATKIGFSYTSYPKNTREYIKAVRAASKSKKYKKEKFLVFAKDPQKNKDRNYRIEKKKNVTIVYYQQISFELSQALIQHSNIPINITGDVSLTLAIQYGKPFSYENNQWKISHTKNLIGKLAASIPPGTPDEEKEIRKRFNAVLKRVLTTDFFSNDTGDNRKSYQEAMEQLFQTPRIHELFGQALYQLRRDASLPFRLRAMFYVLSDVDPAKVTKAELEDRFNVAFMYSDCNNLLQ